MADQSSNRVRIVWEATQSHAYTFDLSKQVVRDEVANLLDWDEDWMVPEAKIPDLVLGLGQMKWELADSEQQDFFLQMSDNSTWVDADLGDCIRIRSIEGGSQ